MDEHPHDASQMADDGFSAISAPPQQQQRPWLTHYSPGVPEAISDFDHQLPWLLEQAVARAGAGVAIDYYGTRITYVQLASLVDRFARALIELGVKRGDRVSIGLPNVPQFPIAFYGALKAGAVAVPTNPLYTPPELRHQLSDAGAKVAIVLDQFYQNLADVRAETPVE